MQFLLSVPTVCQILPKGVVGVLGPSSSPASSSIISNICGEKEVSGHVPCWVGLCQTPLLSFMLPKPSAAPSILCPLSLCPSSRDAACLSWGQQPACSTPGHLWQRCLAGVICLLHSPPCDPLCLLMIRADSLVYHLFPYCSHSCSFFSFHFLSHFCLPCPCFHLCHLFLQLPSRAAPM